MYIAVTINIISINKYLVVYKIYYELFILTDLR